MSEYLRKFKKRHEGYLHRGRDLIMNGDWHLRKSKDFGAKEENFKAENKAVQQIVKRLAVFIKGAEGERQYKETQKYIDEIVDIIDIHLQRISKYYEKNIPTKKYTQKVKIQEEQEFQQVLFDGEINIHESLDKLNISNDFDNLKVEFYDNKITTLPMLEILKDLVPDVRKKIESLEIDWDLILDNEFFINKKKKDIPIYNQNKHFFDQDKDVLQFYVSEWNKIKNGITIDGYYIHGWLYFHLNFFKTTIGNQGDDIMNPPLRDNEWYIHEIIKYAEKKAKELEDAGVFIFGTRRFSKSTCEASWTHFKMLTNPSKNGTLTATNEKDILSITDKINMSMEYIHPFLYTETNSRDWKKQVELGVREKSGRKLKLFTLTIINTDSNSKTGGQKTAGAAPVVFVMDEAGKNSFLKSYNAAIPSFETDDGWKCIPWYVGCVTAGTKVWDNKGNLVNIEDLKQEQGILGFDIENEEISRENIIHMQGRYKKPCYELITNKGRSIRCSEDHPILFRSRNETYGDKKRRGVRKEYFKKTKDFEIGDQIAVMDSIPFYGDKVMWNPKLVGLLIGDGSYGKNKTPVLANCDKNINDYLYSNFDCVHESGYITKDGQEYKETRIRGIRQNLRDLGIIDQTKGDKTLPLNIHSYRKKDIFEMISGIIDADGTVSYLKNNKSIQIGLGFEKLTDELILLLNRVGVHTDKYYYKPNKKNKIDVRGHYRIIIGDKRSLKTLHENCFFMCKHKQDAFNKIIEYQSKKDIKQPKECLNRRFERVVKKTYIGNQYVYNLTAGNTNTYLANGFITHNTGGEEDLSAEAEKVLNDPESFRFLEMNWDILEHGIPKEAITWERRKFGWFIPAQMGYKKGFKRIDRKFSDFLGIESEELSKITIKQTDWVNNTEICKKERQKLKKDRSQLQQETVFYPLDPNECFMSAKNNPYPTADAKKQRERLIAGGNSELGMAKAIELRRDGDKIKYDLSNKEIANFPFSGGNIDCAGVLYGEFPDKKPPFYRFVASADDYKHESSDGDSIGAFYIFDRITKKIVYSLATRPDPHRKFHKQIHMALDAWNAMCFPENEDMKIKEYFDRMHVTDNYLAQGFDPHGKFQVFTSNRKYGWQPNKNTVPIVRGLTIDYAKDISDIKNENGDIIDTSLGVDKVEDIWLLEEMIKYREDGNFDRLVAFGGCLLYDFYLTSMGIFPRMPKMETEEDERPERKNPVKRSVFGSTRRSIF